MSSRCWLAAGVMAVAPFGADPVLAFEKLAELSARLAAVHPGATGISAGMSQDLRNQADWLAYAESSCDFVVQSRLPDSNDLRLGCWQQFISARIKVLQSYRRKFGSPPQDLAQP